MIETIMNNGFSDELDPVFAKNVLKKLVKNGKCLYCEVLDHYWRGRSFHDESGKVILPKIFIHPVLPGKWYLCEDDTLIPIDHCPKCGRKLDINSHVIVITNLNNTAEEIENEKFI